MVRSRINNSEGRSEKEENLGGNNKSSSSSLFTGALFIEPLLQPTDRNVPVPNLDGKNISILLTGTSRSISLQLSQRQVWLPRSGLSCTSLRLIDTLTSRPSSRTHDFCLWPSRRYVIAFARDLRASPCLLPSEEGFLGTFGMGKLRTYLISLRPFHAKLTGNALFRAIGRPILIRTHQTIHIDKALRTLRLPCSAHAASSHPRRFAPPALADRRHWGAGPRHHLHRQVLWPRQPHVLPAHRPQAATTR